MKTDVALQPTPGGSLFIEVDVDGDGNGIDTGEQLVVVVTWWWPM